MKRWKQMLALILSAVALLSTMCINASAKTVAAGQTVGTVLFYVENSKGQEILVSHVTVEEMAADFDAGLLNDTVHNYSLLDRYVTTVHQEAQGFTVPEFVTYAQGKSDVAALQKLNLTFAGQDEIAFWEIDQNTFDDADTYTYNELYGLERYNFPLLYEYWNYRNQDYYDPNGAMTRDQVINHIFANGEPETFLLSVNAFSQRYIITEEKYGTGDYNMENYWYANNKLDTARAIRLMKPMTEAELRNATPTTSDTRYWTANIKLNMVSDPNVTSLGTVTAPTAIMTEDANNYYIKFSCATDGATILFNHNYMSPGYTPTCEYTGGSVVVPKSYFPNGTVTMTCRAVKDGYTDLGVQTMKLTSSGAYKGEEWENPFTDVKSSDWYYDAVAFANQESLFNGTSTTTFAPDTSMNRAMFATVLHRCMGKPAAGKAANFADLDATQTWYHAAVAWASENGYVNGTGGNNFSPNMDISLEAMLTVLHRVSGSPAVSTGVPTRYGAVSSWAANAMAWAAETGLLNGVGGTLTAQGAASRAQVAAILMNYADK